ncbi:MAG: CHAT domain-containing protein [Myxococcales bacterium]|nr:CHAT domain-containing protein [Myxococcales bacterium]
MTSIGHSFHAWLAIAEPRRRIVMLGRLLRLLEVNADSERVIRECESEADVALAQLRQDDVDIRGRAAALWRIHADEVRERLHDVQDESLHAYWPMNSYEDALSCDGDTLSFPTSMPRGEPSDRTKKLVMALVHWAAWATQIADEDDSTDAIRTLWGKAERLKDARKAWERRFEIMRQSLPGNAYRRLCAVADDLAPSPPAEGAGLADWADFINNCEYADAVWSDDAVDLDSSELLDLHKAIEADARLLFDEVQRRAAEMETDVRPVKVLVLAADPTDESKLRLGEEVRAIAEKVRAADRRDDVEIVQHWAVRPDDLLQSLNQHKPDIVHFCGHGSADAISVVGADGNPKEVPNAALVALFKTLKDNIRVVVLNSCFSRTQAEAITEVIDFAVGMSRAVRDDAAVVFAASFYRAVAFGRSVEEAFDQGKVALLVEGIPEDDVPVLIARAGADAATTRLVSGDDAQPTQDGPMVTRSLEGTLYQQVREHYASQGRQVCWPHLSDRDEKIAQGYEVAFHPTTGREIRGGSDHRGRQEHLLMVRPVSRSRVELEGLSQSDQRVVVGDRIEWNGNSATVDLRLVAEQLGWPVETVRSAIQGLAADQTIVVQELGARFAKIAKPSIRTIPIYRG